VQRIHSILLKGLLCGLALGAAYFASAAPAAADPGIGADPVPGLIPGAVYEPVPGAPVAGPLAPPPTIVIPDLLASFPPMPFLPGLGDVDDFSYGDEVLAMPLWVEFSVGPGFMGPATGHPGSPSPPAPRFNVRQEAGFLPPGPFGDGSVNSDVYITYPGPVMGPPPCGPIGTNAQILDGDGAPGAPFGPARLGLNLTEPLTNLDAYERRDNTYVDILAPIGVPERPVFFTISAATAAAWPAFIPLMSAGGPMIPGPSDVLAFDPATGTIVIWALAGVMGLMPGDDIDALSVTWSGMPLMPAGFMPGSMIFFSLAPGSPSLGVPSGGIPAAPLTPLCYGPGMGTAGDVWYVPAPVPPGGALPLFHAEMFGLSTVRSGAGIDDNLDAIDFCPGPVIGDMDGDTINDACDFDRDGDGRGNLADTAVGGVAVSPELPARSGAASDPLQLPAAIWLAAIAGAAAMLAGCGWLLRRRAVAR
jgi:hypothetical protein